MESKNEFQENEITRNNSDGSTIKKDELEFENPSVDPGFANDNELKGLDDEREGNIDSNKNIKEMQEEKENDALNYKNDREHGAYNPKNI